MQAFFYAPEIFVPRLLFKSTSTHADFPILSGMKAANLQKFARTLAKSSQAQSHRDVFDWMQGDMQLFLPHQILICAWGNFETGTIAHDVLSPMAGVRSQHSDSAIVIPLMCQLFAAWAVAGRKPYSINHCTSGFLDAEKCQSGEIAKALQQMHCSLVHGLTDQRAGQDCLYVVFGRQTDFSATERQVMAMAMPHVDTALRQMQLLPHQLHPSSVLKNYEPSSSSQRFDLSDREVQVLYWVNHGKTNPEIGRILNISEFTVKNHMQRIFKKLDVINRAQAVGKLNSIKHHV